MIKINTWRFRYISEGGQADKKRTYYFLEQNDSKVSEARNMHYIYSGLWTLVRTFQQGMLQYSLILYKTCINI